MASSDEPRQTLRFSKRPAFVLAALLIILAGGMPPLLFWLFVGRAPSVSMREAWAELRTGESAPLLVDVRSTQGSSPSRLQRTHSWPASDILAFRSVDDIPPEWNGHTLLLICDGGLSSGMAALRLQSLGFSRVASVRGGLQSWTAQAGIAARSRLEVPGDIDVEASRPISTGSGLTLAIALFVVKPVYMLLSLASILLLARRPLFHLPVVVLALALIFFLVGELACWVNLLFLAEESVALEYLHSISMVVFIALLAWIAITFLDEKILKLSDPKSVCALRGACRQCRKHVKAPCLVESLSRYGVVGLLIVSLMPLAAAPRAISYNASILGLTRNLMHPLSIELYESRFCPLVAFLLLLLTLPFISPNSRGYHLLYRVFLAAGLGHMLFSFFRVVMLSMFDTNLVWFLFWEEVTELILIAGIAYGLGLTRGRRPTRNAMARASL